MINDIIQFVLSLSLWGLPVFVSDRVSVVEQGTDKTPVVCQYTERALVEDGDTSVVHAAWSFVGPATWLDLYEQASEVGKTGSLEFYDWPAGTPVIADLDGSMGDGKYATISGLLALPDGGFRVFQVDHVSPTVLRTIQHFVCGGLVALAVDFTFSAAWGLVVAFTRILF